MDVPFYPNHEDNMHCAVAVYQMLFAFFLHRTMSWDEMEKMAGFADHTAAWTVIIWERMAKQGFDIRMIEAFDYERFGHDGDAYLREYFSPAEYRYQIEHTNIRDIAPFIPNFLEQVRPEHRRPTLGDIDSMLDDDRLVFVTLNARILNDKPGFSSHAVLIIGREDEDFVVHDPGLPPQPGRHVPRAKLWAAMGGEQATSEVTGIKFKPKPTRADIVLARQHPLFARAALAKLFDKKLVHLNGKALKPGEKILSNAVLDADISSLQPDTTTIDLPIIYEDDHCLVINKPAGVLTHAQGEVNREPTVASFLRARLSERLRDARRNDHENVRAGIVHRLDRATSGIILCAKDESTLSFFQKQFAARSVRKTYNAIVRGIPEPHEAIIDMPIERNPKAPATFRVGPNGKPAITHYKVLETHGGLSLLELTPQTGRTHQLRVHLAHIGHAIVGDPLYGDGTFGDRLFLHARRLEVTMPGEKQRRIFEAPLPPEFDEELRHAE